MNSQPWTPADATSKIRACAARDELNLSWPLEIDEQLASRDLLPGDLLCLLRTGTVLDPPQRATRGMYKYAVEGQTPNSDGRSVWLQIVLDGHLELKILEVKWRDECPT